MRCLYLLWATALLAMHAHLGEGLNILGVFPSMSKSHYIAGGALMRGLAAAGHNVTVISPFPSKHPIPNFRDIRATGIQEATKDFMSEVMSFNQLNPIVVILKFFTTGTFVTNYTLTHPETAALLSDQNEHFDVLIIETIISDALLGLGQHYNAPIIGFSPLGASSVLASLVGSPNPVSYVPNMMLSFTDRMSFLERMANAIMYVFDVTTIHYYHALQEQVYNEVFTRKDKPSYQEVLKKGVSFALLNQHFSTSSPRPYVPNMVEVGGIHINRAEPKPLPDDIREFVEGAEHGVIYISLGTNVRSADLPDGVRDGILRTLGTLKERVLWKWEQSDLPGKPKNVFIKNWFPQDDVLGHPNVKLFVTHGGLLSLSEAVYHGLPIIGIPCFGDQPMNMARAVSHGYALTVDFKNLTGSSIAWALDEMISNPKYAEQAKLMSFRYRDQPMQPLDLAMYWVEYVARHKGAPHIQSAGQELSWLQYHSLDVFGVLIGVAVLWTYLIWAVCAWACCKRRTDVQLSNNKQKKL